MNSQTVAKGFSTIRNNAVIRNCHLFTCPKLLISPRCHHTCHTEWNITKKGQTLRNFRTWRFQIKGWKGWKPAVWKLSSNIMVLLDGWDYNFFPIRISFLFTLSRRYSDLQIHNVQSSKTKPFFLYTCLTWRKSAWIGEIYINEEIRTDCHEFCINLLHTEKNNGSLWNKELYSFNNTACGTQATHWRSCKGWLKKKRQVLQGHSFTFFNWKWWAGEMWRKFQKNGLTWI